ncbi:MAG: hypothetical protein JWQ81_8059 [Amycolatopsis sp.]|jgi:hypothetical protein|uniref:hypothetical protein n=1 Tax=Amycolatopsis sp. TaxID=37632 RepID=UPI0026291F0B|nr:hypothetical protein [Amycolatopsis sp.]MCU1687320.1 hypothetical protein [Amycolatopsis sp.]
MKRWAFIIVGALLTLIGLVWTGQGAGIITGSVMSGEKQWFLIGLVCLVIGIGLLVAAVRSRRKVS